MVLLSKACWVAWMALAGHCRAVARCSWPYPRLASSSIEAGAKAGADLAAVSLQMPGHVTARRATRTRSLGYTSSKGEQPS